MAIKDPCISGEPGNLLADKPVVGLIALESVHDVIPVAPRIRAVRIEFESVAVGVPDHVQLLECPTLPIVRRGRSQLFSVSLGSRSWRKASGVGGGTGRSKVTRRKRRIRSSWGDGVSPLACSPSKTKASIGVRIQGSASFGPAAAASEKPSIFHGIQMKASSCRFFEPAVHPTLQLRSSPVILLARTAPPGLDRCSCTPLRRASTASGNLRTPRHSISY